MSDGGEGATVLGDYGVVADEEEGAGKDADDGDHEGREGSGGRGGVGRVEAEGGRGREDDVAPLGAVDAAEALRAVLGDVVGDPHLMAVEGGGAGAGHGLVAEGLWISGPND